ncbi:GntR family transcriptional regulator [Roseibium sp.]|uniref:GntR family transcriptional regulator n=1 Tax=Roseibium sp. TaxID=1936156 RepID=UPI003BAF7234
MKSIKRPKSLTELVTETLREWIVSGDLELGEHLSEIRISKELEVSRTPVREAVNRLEMEGLLSVEPMRGTFVFSLEPSELAKLCDARVCLETAALKEAIRLNPDALHDVLVKCVEDMTRAREQKDDSAYLAADTVFHQCLFDQSDNRFLNDAYQAIAKKMAALRNRLGRHPDHMAKSYREHIELTEAVKNRDVERAMEILKSHIDRKEGSYWSQATVAENA